MSESSAHRSAPNIVNPLKRAGGHVRGVIAMFDEGRSCVALAQQLYAVEKAIGEICRRLIHDHIDHCLNGVVGPYGREAVKEFKTICRYL